MKCDYGSRFISAVGSLNKLKPAVAGPRRCACTTGVPFRDLAHRWRRGEQVVWSSVTVIRGHNENKSAIYTKNTSGHCPGFCFACPLLAPPVAIDCLEAMHLSPDHIANIVRIIVAPTFVPSAIPSRPTW
jgi:hypothetical protein